MSITCKLILFFSICFFNANGNEHLINIRHKTTQQQKDVKDANPVDIIKQSMKSAGNYESIKTLKIKTTRKNYNKWQNYSFTNPKPTNDEAYREIDFINKRLYFKTVSRYGGGYLFEFVTVGSDSTIYNYDVNGSRNGKKIAKGNKKVLESNLQSQSAFLPFYNLKALLELNDSLSSRNETTGPVVTRQLKNGTKWDYYFSAKHYQLIRTTNFQPGQVIDTWYKDYTQLKDIWYPKKIEVFINKELLTKDEVLSVKTDEAFNESLLSLPKGYFIAETTPAEMKVSQIKKDIYLIENVQGRNILFVALKDGILVTEAPLSSDVTKNIINLIKKTVPDKPIRYVHISHFHNDHTHGIRAYVHEGASIVMTLATATALMEVINDSTGKYNDELSKSRREPKFELFEEHKTITDGNHTIAFYSVKSKHAQGMSFLRLPNEKIIYQGDLYTLPDDHTITPAIETTRDFNQFLIKKGLTFERMIGHHGSNFITQQILQKAITLK
jgi:glyoxylase-like metal-dependent hydrolase (beta-lactamase superfamily II)